MEVASGEFMPGREVDELRWVDLAGAAHLLSYERDRDLLVALGAAAHDLFADHPAVPDLRLVEHPGAPGDAAAAR
jgi:hypothetical protein